MEMAWATQPLKTVIYLWWQVSVLKWQLSLAYHPDVTTVAGDATDIATVAAADTNIATVATNITNVNNVGGDIANVNSVGTDIANVNTVANNLSGVNSFGERYRVSATAPSTSLDSGDLWFDTTNNLMKVYGDSGFVNAGSSVNGTSSRNDYVVGTASGIYRQHN